MTPRLDHKTQTPRAAAAMNRLNEAVELGPPLRELINVRASQINGCAYCIDMHTKDARADGESEQRLYALNAWRETPFFSARERAALEWTESVTLVSESHVPDETYASVREQFSQDELANLTMAIVAINGWNRIAISFRSTPGTYEPPVRNERPAG